MYLTKDGRVGSWSSPEKSQQPKQKCSSHGEALRFIAPASIRSRERKRQSVRVIAQKGTRPGGNPFTRGGEGEARVSGGNGPVRCAASIPSERYTQDDSPSTRRSPQQPAAPTRWYGPLSLSPASKGTVPAELRMLVRAGRAGGARPGPSRNDASHVCGSMRARQRRYPLQTPVAARRPGGNRIPAAEWKRVSALVSSGTHSAVDFSTRAGGGALMSARTKAWEGIRSSNLAGWAGLSDTMPRIVPGVLRHAASFPIVGGNAVDAQLSG
jgi:hypothetical protein